jgi:hypothetical protein
MRQGGAPECDKFQLETMRPGAGLGGRLNSRPQAHQSRHERLQVDRPEHEPIRRLGPAHGKAQIVRRQASDAAHRPIGSKRRVSRVKHSKSSWAQLPDFRSIATMALNESRSRCHTKLSQVPQLRVTVLTRPFACRVTEIPESRSPAPSATQILSRRHTACGRREPTQPVCASQPRAIDHAPHGLQKHLGRERLLQERDRVAGRAPVEDVRSGVG